MNALQLKTVSRTLRGLGPYLLIELLLPGGTVIALTLWLIRRARAGSAPAACDEADAGVVASLESHQGAVLVALK
jgi:hypothetical protein